MDNNTAVLDSFTEIPDTMCWKRAALEQIKLFRLFANEQAVKAVPIRLRQRQDALESQLQTLLEMATRAGCYDAADWLRKRLEENKT